jgi:hypothetical protein
VMLISYIHGDGRSGSRSWPGGRSCCRLAVVVVDLDLPVEWWVGLPCRALERDRARPNSELLAAGGRGLTTQREDQAAIAEPDRLTPFSGVIAQPQAMGPGVAAVSAQPGRGKIK